MTRTARLALLALFVPLTAQAAPATPEVAVPPPEAPKKPLDTNGDPQFTHKPPRAPGEKVALQLEDADLSDLAKVIGELTGEKYLVASSKLGKLKASVYAPQKVTVAEARQAFLAVLAANGLTVIPQGGFYKIVESQDVARQLTPIERGELPRDERYVTRIHRLAHLSAEEVATNVLSKLATKDASIVPYTPSNLLIITETAANLRRMLDVLSAIDEAGEEDKLWLQPLKYVSSSQVEKQLKDILGIDKKAEQAAGPLHVGRVVAIDRPNALAIVATKASYDRIVDVLERIDLPPTNESQVRVVPLQHSEAKKIVGPINEALGASAQAAGGKNAPPATPAATLEAPVKISADETTNSLIVTAGARDFAQVKGVIDALDKPKRQVYIEAVVLDVSSERGLDLGSAFHGGDVSSSMFGSSGSQTVYGGFRPISSAAPGTGDLQAFALGVRGPTIPFSGIIPGVSQIPSFGALLTAVAQSKSSDILSTPHILASDNTKAEIRVQLNTSLQPNAPQTSTISNLAATSGAASALSGLNFGTQSVSNNYKPIGPKIIITPHLNESDEVRLDVEELISDVQSTPDKGDTYGTVSYLERAATTTLTVPNGETAVIGGLVRNRTARSETKVPILGDIPLLGVLFRTRSDRVEKSNLVLILTPHIVKDQADLKGIFERKMQERQELIDHEAIFDENAKWSPPKDYRHAKGALGDIRSNYADVVRRRRDAQELAPRDLEAGRTAPLDLPVPQGTGAAHDKPAAAAPSKPTVVEK